MQKRIQISTALGAFLGIFCIIGVGTRLRILFGDNNSLENWMFLFGMWYNRVIMGFLIGLSGRFQFIKGKYNPIFRGAVFGLMVTNAIAFSTAFRDIPSYLAGIVYGVIIDVIATKVSNKE